MGFILGTVVAPSITGAPEGSAVCGRSYGGAMSNQYFSTLSHSMLSWYPYDSVFAAAFIVTPKAFLNALDGLEGSNAGHISILVVSVMRVFWPGPMVLGSTRWMILLIGFPKKERSSVMKVTSMEPTLTKVYV